MQRRFLSALFSDYNAMHCIWKENRRIEAFNLTFQSSSAILHINPMHTKHCTCIEWCVELCYWKWPNKYRGSDEAWFTWVHKHANATRVYKVLESQVQTLTKLWTHWLTWGHSPSLLSLSQSQASCGTKRGTNNVTWHVHGWHNKKYIWANKTDIQISIKLGKFLTETSQNWYCMLLRDIPPLSQLSHKQKIKGGKDLN